MTDTLRPAEQLRHQAAIAYATVRLLDTRIQTRSAELDLLIHDAEAREHRRAAHLARDRDCYRLGSAFEPTGGLKLDPIAMTGFLSLGTAGLLLLTREALAAPTASILEQFASLFRSASGSVIRDQGVWVRWHWLRELYEDDVTTFLASREGRDPKARWRTKAPTRRQTYLVSEICSALQLDDRSFDTRHEAFAWIKAHADNPRFQIEPPKPDLSTLGEAFR